MHREMVNPFGSDDMAGGYAAFRPPLHPCIIEQVISHLGCVIPFERVLDVGCGAGLSTKAIGRFANRCIGIDPAEVMLKWAAAATHSAHFIAGTAEAIPIRDRAVDVITAAGSLNYVNLVQFFPEALRVLTPRGLLVIYDFSPGRHFRHATGLDEWFSTFAERYPAVPDEARMLNPEILAELDSGFRMQGHRYFEIGLAMTSDVYIDYVMTETNVAAALRNGERRCDIKSWCAETLAPIWPGQQPDVLFRGYFACLIPAVGTSSPPLL